MDRHVDGSEESVQAAYYSESLLTHKYYSIIIGLEAPFHALGTPHCMEVINLTVALCPSYFAISVAMTSP